MEFSFEVLPDEEHALIDKLVPQMRARIEEETGVRVPGIRFSVFEGASTNAYRVFINEVLAAQGVLKVDDVDARASLGHQQLLSAAIDRLDGLLRSKLSLWIEVQEVQNLLERHCNDLYRRDIEGFESHAHIRPLVYIVQELVDQDVPIIAFSDIYAVFRRLRFTRSVDDIVDEARELPRVRPYLPGNSETFKRHVLSLRTERWLLSRVRTAGDATVLVLRPEERRALSAALHGLVRRAGNAALVVRQRELRRHVWRVVREDRLGLPVLSERELMSALSPETPELELESGDIPDVLAPERKAP
jgi:flagellar biosynthesis component FlhA